MTDTPASGSRNPGWYPDPWASGQHRYWDGETWTPNAFPDGPAGQTTSPWAPPADAQVAGPPDPVLRDAPLSAAPPPPEWAPPGSGATSPGPALPPVPPPPPAARPDPSSPLSPLRVVAILTVIALIVGFSAFGVAYALSDRSKAPSRVAAGGPAGGPLPTSPGSTVPPDPAASALSGLILSQADVGSALTVQLSRGGRGTSMPTLDLCNGTYPSEKLRTARLQVDGFDSQGTVPLSTEAVLYANPAATAQAFAELTDVAAKCPSGPVTSHVGDPTLSTHFNAAPDGAWPQVATVQRLAFDFVTTDQAGQTQHSVATYLRRGRVLMGIYFAQPDAPQAAVSGQTTIPGIVNVFANRMAQLPASVVNG